MSNPSTCPKCSADSIYEDGNLWVCASCFHEWSALAQSTARAEPDTRIKDANGNALNDGDTVVVIKDLKVKGSSSVVKGGTKVKGIRLVDGDDGHNIACKIEGFGAMNLKSEFVKKA